MQFSFCYALSSGISRGRARRIARLCTPASMQHIIIYIRTSTMSFMITAVPCTLHACHACRRILSRRQHACISQPLHVNHKYHMYIDACMYKCNVYANHRNQQDIVISEINTMKAVHSQAVVEAISSVAPLLVNNEFVHPAWEVMLQASYLS